MVLTNDYRANDTYALGNNDLESPMKTFARFAQVPSTARAGELITVTGLAQVQYWLHPADVPLPDYRSERHRATDASTIPEVGAGGDPARVTRRRGVRSAQPTAPPAQ